MREEILKHVNDFLASKGKGPITVDEKLWTSGLLDSLEMFELVLYFDQLQRPMSKDRLTQKSPLIDLGEIDNVDGIIRNMEEL